LAFLDKFEVGAQSRVLERIPPASRKVIESTLGVGFIPIEHDHWVVDGIIEVLGRERAILFWREVMVDLLERPPLFSFVSRMVRELGRDPVSVVRLFAKGWPLVYRDMCQPVLIATKDGQPAIRFQNIAPAVRAHRNYLDSWHGVCQGFVHVARVRGSVAFSVAPDVSWAEAKFYWE
jgi:hypothetical protein